MLVSSSRPEPKLTNREFAEQFVMLPKTSPYGNVPFRCYRQPYTSLLFDEMDNGRWSTYLVSGPSQSGKTLSAFVIPTLRDVIALKLNTIVGFPEADMASDKWDTDFRPTFEASPRLRALMPQSGPGSKGGRIKDRVTLGNGVDIKIMTKGGDDTSKAGYTSPRVRVTEAAAWSHSSENSVEANPLRQLKARMKAFKRDDPRRCLFVEGTLTTEDELPWSGRGDDEDERLVSTRSRIVSQCPHCGKWVAPERKHLVGWREAQSEDEAANNARWLCPECSDPITNDQRRKAVANCRLVHWGQWVDQFGDVQGELPPTKTLWFHWSAWDNLLRDIADFAAAEWEAAQIEEGTAESENAEKELCQFDFSVPFKSKLTEYDPLKPAVLRKKTDEWKKNTLPPDTEKFTIGVDLGDTYGWWFGTAGRSSGLLHCPTWGKFRIKHEKDDDLEASLKRALREVFESFNEGYTMAYADGLVLPDLVWIDIGYLPDWVADVVREYGSWFDNRFRCVRGRGSCMKTPKGNAGGLYNHPLAISQAIPYIGTQWHSRMNYERQVPENTFNADFWKMQLAHHLRKERGKRGSLTLYKPDRWKEHDELVSHLTNEQFKKYWDTAKGALVEGWVQTGANHLNDSAAMSLGALDECGFELIACPDPAEAEAEAESADQQEQQSVDVEQQAVTEDVVNIYAELLRDS